MVLPEDAGTGAVPHRAAEEVLASQSVGVAAGSHEELGCGHRADALGGQQGEVHSGDQLAELIIEFAGLGGEELVALREHLQRGQQGTDHAGLGGWSARCEGVDELFRAQRPVLLPHRDG